MFKKILMSTPVEGEDPLIEEVENQCRNCAYRNAENQMVCEAFPKGIPLSIYLGRFDHTLPYMIDGEEADGGLRYAPKDDPLTNGLPSDSL